MYFKSIFLSIIMILSGIAIIPASVNAADSAIDRSSQASCEALGDLSPSGSGTCANPDGPGINRILTIALNLLSVVAGVVAVIMLIISGLKYVTSQGDSNQISSAKQALVYVIVGLIVVVFAQFIVKFVLNRVAG